MEPLIRALNVIDEIDFIREYRVWRPWWEKLEVFTAVVNALREIGDVRATGPLASALESENLWLEVFYSGNTTLYHGFFTIPIVEAMIEIGIDKITENERSLAGAHLKLMLEISSYEGFHEEMYAASFGDSFYEHFNGERIAELICEVGPAYCSHWRIASCSGLMRMALWETPDETFCELLTQNLENRTQPLIRIMEESRGIYSRAAAEALNRQGWQPDTDELRANYLIATEQWDQGRMNTGLRELRIYGLFGHHF